jgi:hypothetical protein
MKKFTKLFALLFVVFAATVSLAACDKLDVKTDCKCDEKETTVTVVEPEKFDYVGNYKTIWTEGTKAEGYDNGEIEILADNTFTFKVSFDGEKIELRGTWAGNMSKEEYVIICFVDKYFDADGEELDRYRSYFTMQLLDNGKFLIQIGLDNISGDAFNQGGYIMVCEREEI